MFFCLCPIKGWTSWFLIETFFDCLVEVRGCLVGRRTIEWIVMLKVFVICDLRRFLPPFGLGMPTDTYKLAVINRTIYETITNSIEQLKQFG